MQFNFLKKLLAKFRGNDERKILTEVLSDSRAVFSSFGNDIYFSDLVANCLDRIASEISKIDVVSVVEEKDMYDAVRTIFRGFSSISRIRCRRRKIFWHLASGSGANI